MHSQNLQSEAFRLFPQVGIALECPPLTAPYSHPESDSRPQTQKRPFISWSQHSRQETVQHGTACKAAVSGWLGSNKDRHVFIDPLAI